MGHIVDIQERRRHLAARRGFQGWVRRFSEAYDETTRPLDLSDAALSVLIRSGGDASMPLYEFILGVKGLGMGPKFYYLESAEKMEVMDIALFLLDQLRFEAMRRLGWVEDHPTLHIPLVDLVDEFTSAFEAVKHQSPSLAPGHPLFPEYQEEFEGDRSVFVRRLIPEVLEVFGQERSGE